MKHTSLLNCYLMETSGKNKVLHSGTTAKLPKGKYCYMRDCT